MSLPPGSGAQPGDPYSNSPYGQPQYGQPQYGQPQHGQPQYGQPYGSAPYGEPQFPQQPRYGEIPTGPPPMPMPPIPPKKSKTGAIVAALVVALAVVGGAVALVVVKQQSDKVGAEGEDVMVGQCITVDGSDELAMAKSADCSDPKALWQVAVNLDSTSSPCPDGDYDEYHYNSGTKLCLTLNVKTGDCLANLSGNMAEISKVNCTDAGAEVVILAAQDGVTDVEGVCGGFEDAFGGGYYSEPARVLCFGYPQGV